MTNPGGKSGADRIIAQLLESAREQAADFNVAGAAQFSALTAGSMAMAVQVAQLLESKQIIDAYYTEQQKEIVALAVRRQRVADILTLRSVLDLKLKKLKEYYDSHTKECDSAVCGATMEGMGIAFEYVVELLTHVANANHNFIGEEHLREGEQKDSPPIRMGDLIEAALRHEPEGRPTDSRAFQKQIAELMLFDALGMTEGYKLWT